MFAFASKILAPAASPLVMACILLAIAVWYGRRRPRLARGASAAALIILLLASNAWVSMLFAGYLESKNIPKGPLPDAQAIVVLASDAEPASPPQPTVWVDNATANRLLFAVKLFREGKAPLVILSGGRLPWLKDLPPMSASMAKVIELMGVPQAAIIEETVSGNTYQNAVDVKAILEARKIRRILLVTSALHMPRALGLFRHQGIDAIAAPCDFMSAPTSWHGYTSDWQARAVGLIPSDSNLDVTTRSMREILGIAVYRLMGRL